MYKESIDRENKKLKDELRVLKSAMQHIGTDVSPLKSPVSITKDPLRLQLSSPKGSFSSHIPGLKTLIEAAKPGSEGGSMKKKQTWEVRREGGVEGETGEVKEVDVIKTEVEQELASLRGRLESMKTQYSGRKTQEAKLLCEQAVQTESNTQVNMWQQTDPKDTSEEAAQTTDFPRTDFAERDRTDSAHKETRDFPGRDRTEFKERERTDSEELDFPQRKPVETAHEEESELVHEFQLLKDENQALRILLNRKKQKQSGIDQDYDVLPSREKTIKRKGKTQERDPRKSPKGLPTCSHCLYLLAHGLPTSSCRKHRKEV